MNSTFKELLSLIEAGKLTCGQFVLYVRRDCGLIRVEKLVAEAGNKTYVSNNSLDWAAFYSLVKCDWELPNRINWTNGGLAVGCWECNTVLPSKQYIYG